MKSSSIFFIAATVALFSCGKGGDSPTATPPKDNVIRFSGSKTSLTSSTTTPFADNDQIGVYMSTANAALASSGNHLDNLLFTYKTSNFTASTSPIFPADVTNVDIYAYAPYNASGIDADGNISFSVAQDQSSTKASDLLWVKSGNVATTSVNPNLVFGHKLSQIVINLSIGTGVTLGTPSVTVNNTLPTVKMAMSTGVLDAAQGASKTITASVVSTLVHHAIIVPQLIAKDVELFTITNDGKTYPYVLKEAKTFVSGTSYPYNIVINKSGIEVTFDGSVDGWVDGGSESGVVS